MASKIEKDPVVAHRFEELLVQLENHGLKRNGHDALLARAANAET